jgi:hypothetical protein
MRSDATTCEAISELLPEFADRDSVAEPRIVRHVDSCLRCQAELVQYRKLLRTLHQLRTELIEPAPGVVAGVLATLGAAGERRAVRSIMTGRNVAYVGGIAAATAATAVGAVLFANRSRVRRLAG